MPHQMAADVERTRNPTISTSTESEPELENPSSASSLGTPASRSRTIENCVATSRTFSASPSPIETDRRPTIPHQVWRGKTPGKTKHSDSRSRWIERLQTCPRPTGEDARAAIGEYIEFFCNRVRRDSMIADVGPVTLVIAGGSRHESRHCITKRVSSILEQGDQAPSSFE